MNDASLLSGLNRCALRAAGAIAILVAPSARAETETVHLANGSVFAGELVEKVPNDHVTIKLPTGELRRFDWAALAPALAAAQTLAAPPALVPQLPPLAPRTGHVQLASDAKGTLLMRVDQLAVNFQGWIQSRESPVCYAPCSADVDANASYYVTGVGVTPSSHFAIPEGRAPLSVRTGSYTVMIAGAWMVATGILSTITGGIATPIAFADAKTSAINGWEAFGLSTLIGGAVFILAGIPLLVAGRTRVTLGDVYVARAHTRWLPNGLAF